MKVEYYGNIFNHTFMGGYAGSVFLPSGISPTINTAQGGYRMPIVIVEV